MQTIKIKKSKTKKKKPPKQKKNYIRCERNQREKKRNL